MKLVTVLVLGCLLSGVTHARDIAYGTLTGIKLYDFSKVWFYKFKKQRNVE